MGVGRMDDDSGMQLVQYGVVVTNSGHEEGMVVGFLHYGVTGAVAP